MYVTDEHIDVMKELINIGVGRAAGSLNMMLRSHVHLQVPSIEVLLPSALEERIRGLKGEMLSIVQLTFRGPFSGVASLIFPTKSAAKLVAVLTEDERYSVDLDDSIRIGTLTEVGNIVLNGVMGVIGNEVEQYIHFSVPTYAENPIEVLLAPSDSNDSVLVVWAQAQFTVERHQIDGDIILLFEVGLFDVLLAALNRKVGAPS